MRDHEEDAREIESQAKEEEQQSEEESMTVYMRFTKDGSEEPFQVQPGDQILKQLEKTLMGSARHFKYNVYFCEELIEDEESTFDGDDTPIEI